VALPSRQASDGLSQASHTIPPGDPFRPSGRIRAVLTAILFFSIIGTVTVFYVLVCALLFASRRHRILAGNVYGKTLGRVTFFITGIHPRIRNPERVDPARPALYVCNHSSTIDMWVGMWLCPFGGCGVAKKEIVKVPFFGIAYLLSGHLMLDRGNRERAIRSMEKVSEVVHRHRLSVWMWPEGTRSRSGRLLPLKKGFVHMAVATGLPIVPIVFHDADLRWPGGSLRPSAGELHMEVLEAVETTDWSVETAGEHAQAIWQILQDRLSERQKALPE